MKSATNLEKLKTKEIIKNKFNPPKTKQDSLLGKKLKISEEIKHNNRLNKFKNPENNKKKLNFSLENNQKKSENFEANKKFLKKSLSLNSGSSKIKDTKNFSNDSKIPIGIVIMKKNSNISFTQKLKSKNLKENFNKKNFEKKTFTKKIKNDSEDKLIKTTPKKTYNKSAEKEKSKKSSLKKSLKNSENFSEEKNEGKLSSVKKRKYLDEEDAYVFKSSGKKSPGRKKKLSENEEENTSTMKFNTNKSKSASSLKRLNNSGKRSKTKSIISDYGNLNTLTKSEKESIKSLRSSVKKINFDHIESEEDNLSSSFDVNEKSNKKKKTYLKQGKNQLSRSRSVKEELEKIKIASKNKIKLKNNIIPLIKNKKYENVVSKVSKIFDKTKIAKSEENKNDKIEPISEKPTTKLINGIKSDFNKKIQKNSDSQNTSTSNTKSPSLLKEINESILRNSQKFKKPSIVDTDEKSKNLIYSMKSAKSDIFKNDYMGMGKDGLNLFETEGENNGILSNDPLSLLNKSNLPCFSEGYLFNKIIQKETEEKTEEKNQLETQENFNNENPPNFPERNNLKNQLVSALKNSYKKCIPLNSELKLMSKEFRFLLSGKKLEAKFTNEILAQKIKENEEKENVEKEEKENVEKKLIFEENEKMEKENLEEEEYENLNDEEVLELENEILQKVLEENFGLNNFLPGQLATIKNVLNFKSTLTILPPSYGKSLCYQLPSLVLDGLTIVICPLLASITDQLTNLPGCLSGASLTSFTNQNQRNEIFDAIKQKKIKILFITPERLALENFSELDQISLICFDDVISCSPLSQNFRSSYISIIPMLEKIKPNSVLFLGNNITNLVENSLIELFNLQKENIIKEKLSLPKNLKVSISKDENKLSSIVKLLRSNTAKNIGSITIFCNLRKTVDRVTSFLNQNGLSASAYHAGKSEIERQVIQSNFLNDKIKILVATSGFCNGICKSDIRFVILFDIPSSIDLFLQQINRGGRDKKETNVHIFLNDEDYFIQRNMIYYDNFDKSSISKFVENLFYPCIKKIYCYKESKENLNSVKENNPKNFLLNCDAKENSNLKSKTKSYFDLPKKVNFNFTKNAEATGIKKNMQIFLLLRLLNDKKINCNESDLSSNGKLKASCLGIGPTDINLRFFKSSPEELAENEPNLQIILENSKLLVGGIYKFSTGEVCQKLGITYIDLINYLYFLQNKGEIGYESRDEGMFINVENIPENVDDIVNYLYITNKYLVNLNIKKVNFFLIFYIFIS